MLESSLEFLFIAAMTAILAAIFLPLSRWNRQTVIIVLLIAVGVFFVDHEAGFLLALGVVLLLPWSLMKHVPRRKIVYIAGIVVLIVGNAAHLVWIWLQDYATYDLLPALYFLGGLIGGLLLFNLLAFILWLVYREKTISG